MQVAELPSDENERIALLESLEILDTEPEKSFDEVTSIAAKICKTPIALISLVDRERQWFKSAKGLDAKETHRDLAFCAHAILKDKPFVVLDSSKDERFKDNPLVTGEPNVAFYVGIPIKVEDGNKSHNIGTLCIIDTKPREKISALHLELLQVLAHQVESRIEIRKNFSIVRKAAVEAARASREKSVFLSNVAHELRTPLNGIVGYSNLLSEDQVSKKQREFIEAIRSSSSHLLQVVNDLLDISKIEAGKFEITPETTDFKQFLSDSIQVFELNKKVNPKIKFEKFIQKEIPAYFNMDATRVRQVLFNVVGNAFKFTPHGKVSFSTSYFGSSTKGNLYFEVKDTGVGIPENALPTIFQRFSQADNQDSSIPSSGLGLSLCKNLLRLMNGEIHITSKHGKGTNINIFIPVDVINQKSNVNRTSSKNQNLDLSHFRILIADDNLLNRKLLMHLLSKHKANPDYAEDGNKCIEILQNQNYDLVLLDIRMPGKTGIEIIKWIRNNQKNQPIAYAVSASIMKEQAKEMLDAGFDGVIPKPIESKVLLRNLNDFLSLKKASSE